MTKDGITLTTIRHPRGKPALGDLNPESLEQVEIDLTEPVAWGVFEGNLHDMFFTQSEAQEMANLKGTHAEVRPLYTTPQRTEQEQEPVLWMMPDGNTADKWALQFYGGQKGKPLYTTPPQRTWVGLTDEEIWEALGGIDCTRPMLIARAIEAKLKEKNGF